MMGSMVLASPSDHGSRKNTASMPAPSAASSHISRVMLAMKVTSGVALPGLACFQRARMSSTTHSGKMLPTTTRVMPR
ncbi:hypothetical protein GALL_548520 [mine drainage metagenome]|uniref:Uncharacterized protein n=1 Tax=mine drainage metagenome TaxID=410659 RepID=A0A1J5NWL4_9ZZZZ